MNVLIHRPLQFAFERQEGLAENHLRTQVAAVHASVEHGHGGHYEHQEHHRKEDDGELADPEFIAEEVKTLLGNVEAHQARQRQSEENDHADGMDEFAQAVIVKTRLDHGRLRAASLHTVTLGQGLVENDHALVAGVGRLLNDRHGRHGLLHL
jgi:hypothetical protein